MTFGEFHNALRIMLNIDQHETGLDKAAFATFQADPFRWFIRASDENARKVWAIIEDRQPRASCSGRSRG
jgi:hypothetical protein